MTGIVLVITVILFIIILIGALTSISIPSFRGRVALLEVEGVIYDVREIINELHSYRDNNSIRAIIVRINSPGGSAAASQELYEELKKIRSSGGKPVVVSMGSTAASGGYYIACGADEIYANPATLTGSIGVIMNFTNWEKLIKKVGIRFEVVKSGKNKDIGSPNRPMTEEERELLQEIIDDVYDQFIEAIYESRGKHLKRSMDRLQLEPEDSGTTDSVRQYLRNLADGRIFSGRQAFEYGLVDRLGNLQDAVKRAAVLGGIRGYPSVYKRKKKKGLFDMLEGKWKNSIRGISLDSPMIEYRYIPK